MKKLYLLSSILFLISANVSGQLSVTSGVTPATLVNTILGTGVSVSNITVNGAPASSRGTFTCGGSCNIGFPNGIILTSGSAAIAGAVNTGTGQGQDNGVGGDTQLDALTTGTTLDACVLEFDFSVASDSVVFNYMFASEEYSDYVGFSFNDVFGFFISGPGIVGQKNIAVIPGTSTPVSINTVNNGNSPVIPTGPCTNCSYFRDNVSNLFTTAYDGLTTILTAGSRVQPCATYHIKLAVADVGDHVFDTGVFLKGNSFSSFGALHILANGVTYASGSTVHVCTGTNVTLSVNPESNYSWSTGETTQSIVVNEANIVPGGNYQFQTSFGSCFAFSTIQIVFDSPSATITSSGPVSFCMGSDVTLNAPTGTNKTYQWKKGTNLISGATLSSYTATTGGNYRVIVTNTVTGCSATTINATIVTVNPLPNATITAQGPTTFCAGGSVVLKANSGTGLTYQWKKGGANISGATLLNYTATTAGVYKVKTTNSSGCGKLSVGVTITIPCKEGETILSSNNFDFTIYPNPNSGEFTIKFSTKPTSSIQIELTDEIGEIVKRFETIGETIVIKESNLAKGIYCLTARNNNEVVIKKINIVK